MYDIDKIREDFPILRRTVYGRPLVYLDTAATAQKPKCVLDKLDELYRNLNANVHRGVHFLSAQATEEYEAARETVRGFINAGSTAEVVFTSGATAAINLVAYSYGEAFIGPGDNVVVSEIEHHSNIVPWQIVCGRKGADIRVLPADDTGRLMAERLADLIDGRTKMVAVTHASNVLGTMPDLSTITSVAHAAGVPVLVDGCQGVVHGGVDVQLIDCDFYAFSGHKLYGPTGTGVLYGRREWLDRMPPFMGGGDMVANVSFAGTTYAPLPLKFEAGTANFIDAIAMAEAVKYLAGLGPSDIREHERALLAHATAEISRIEGVKIYGTEPEKCPILSFTAEGAHPYDIGMILDKQGVAVRTGMLCAEPLLERYGITGVCRASFGLYTTREEVDVFAAALRRALSMLR